MKPPFALIAIACTLVAAEITPLNVKLGEWETTSRIQMSGLPGISQETLDKMPPQRRAMMEERMKTLQGRATVIKTCVKPEDLDKATAFGAADKSCTHTVITSSSTRQEIKIECHRNGATQTGTVIVERPDNEHVKGTVRMSMEHGDRTMTANSTYESKWLGPTCSEQDK